MLKPPALHLRIEPAAERAVRSGHPWVFADRIKEANREGRSGELAVIYDKQDRFLAAGLFDPASNIRVRVLQAVKPARIDEAWWKERLEEALRIRSSLMGGETNGLRLINGENDRFPGLVADQYAGTIVVKLYSAIWFPWLEQVLGLLRARLAPERIVLRLSRNIAASAPAGLKDGSILHGSAPVGPVVFQEEGLKFEAEVIQGQKTGFFLDQRENRRLLADYSAGKDVLNAFSFSGGFSLHAARGGARSVSDLDISKHALESARRNFALNTSIPAVAACRHLQIQADAFEWLAGAAGERFNVVVVDPPSLAKREVERAGAIRAYAALNRNAAALVRRGGLLLAASCSAHVSQEEFYGSVKSCLAESGRPFQELHATDHATDHPATYPEGRYLKALFLRLG